MKSMLRSQRNVYMREQHSIELCVCVCAHTRTHLHVQTVPEELEIHLILCKYLDSFQNGGHG